MSLQWSADKIDDATYHAKFIDVPRVISDWLSEHGGIAGKDILDFGCGEATMALGLALQYGPRRVVGVEIHDEIDNALPYATAQLGLDRLPDNLELRLVDPDASLEALGTFDIIYSWSVFEHVSQELIVDCLAKMRRVMRPDGIMFLQTTPLYYSAEGAHLMPVVAAPWSHLSMQQDRLYDELRRNADSPEQAEHLQWVYERLNRVTAPGLLRCAEQAGFAVIKEYRTYNEIVVPEDLKEIYTMEALTTNQLVFLAKHA